MIFHALSFNNEDFSLDISQEALENAFISLPPLTFKKCTKIVKHVTKLSLPTSQANEDTSMARQQHHRADARVAIYRKQGGKISTWM